MLQTVTDHRTQIYLPRDMYRVIKKIAGSRSVSLSEVIREAIRRQFMVDYRKERGDFQKVKFKFLSLAGAGRGPSDLSKNHDKYA